MQIPLPELPDGPSLETARGPVPIPLLETWQWAGILIPGAVLLILAAWLIFKFGKRRRASADRTLDPLQAASNALDQAADCEDAPMFGTLCSSALRTYCSDAFGTGSPSLSTSEFLAKAVASPGIGAAPLADLSVILRKCDELKFARTNLRADERSTLLAKAGEWIGDRNKELTSADNELEPEAVIAPRT